MKKVIRDGKVAVIFSFNFGAGWYSWHGIEELLFDPNVVKMIEDGESPHKYCEELYKGIYISSELNLAIAWIPEGSEFYIDEYDGREEIIFKESQSWLKA